MDLGVKMAVFGPGTTSVTEIGVSHSRDAVRCITVIAWTEETRAAPVQREATCKGRWQLALLVRVIFDRTDAIQYAQQAQPGGAQRHPAFCPAARISHLLHAGYLTKPMRLA